MGTQDHYIYRPSIGAKGTTEYNKFDQGLAAADTALYNLMTMNFTEDTAPTIADWIRIYNSTTGLPSKVAVGNLLKGRGVTITVAASDSNKPYNADYTCTGTNDQDTINTAINAASPGGRVVLLEGTYYINNVSGQIYGIYLSDTNNNFNVTIEGQGMGTLLKVPNGNSTNGMPIIYVRGESVPLTGVRVKNLRIDGNRSNVTGTFYMGIDINNTNNIEVDGVYLTNGKGTGGDGYGYIIIGSTDITIRNCTGLDWDYEPMEIRSSNRVLITACKLDYRIELYDNNNDISIFGNSFYNLTIAAGTWTYGSDYIKGLTISGNSFYADDNLDANNSAAIGLGRTYGAVVSNNAVRDTCAVRYYGLVSNICDYSIIVGNAVYCRTPIQEGGNYTLIENNIIILSKNEWAHGIAVHSNGPRVIRNNVIVGGSSTNGITVYSGAYPNDTAPTTGGTISGNYLKGHNYGIYVDVGSTDVNILTDNIFDGCTIKVFENNGGGLDATGSCLLTNYQFKDDLSSWTATNWTWSSGAAVHTTGNTSAISQAASITVGKSYVLVYQLEVGGTGGSVVASVGGCSDVARSAGGNRHAFRFIATTTDSVALTPTSDFDYPIGFVYLFESKPYYFGSTGGLVAATLEAAANIEGDASTTITLNIPSGVRIRGVQLRVDVALAAAEHWDAAFSGGCTASICSNQEEAKNTKVNAMYEFHDANSITSGTTNIAITKNGGGSFTAQGNIRAIVYYETFTAMSNAA